MDNQFDLSPMVFPFNFYSFLLTGIWLAAYISNEIHDDIRWLQVASRMLLLITVCFCCLDLSLFLFTGGITGCVIQVVIFLLMCIANIPQVCSTGKRTGSGFLLYIKFTAFALAN